MYRAGLQLLALGSKTRAWFPLTQRRGRCLDRALQIGQKNRPPKLQGADSFLGGSNTLAMPNYAMPSHAVPRFTPVQHCIFKVRAQGVSA